MAPRGNAAGPCATGFIGRDGRFAIPPRFQGAGDFSDGLAPVMIDGQWGYVDRRGAIVIAPRFTAALPFREGLAAVRNDNGEWGYAGRDGRLVIPFRYRSAEPFSESLARVVTGDEYRRVFIDRSGRERFPGGQVSDGPLVLGLWPALDESGVSYRDRHGKPVFRYRPE